MRTYRGEWFTAARVERLTAILPALPSRHAPPGVSREAAHRSLFPLVGSGATEIDECLNALQALGLIAGQDALARSVEGDKVVRAYRRGDRHSLALHVLRSGAMGEQVRQLLAIAQGRPEALVVEPSVARRTSAQLLGILGRIPGFEAGPPCRITGELRAELESAWTLRDPPALSTPSFVDERSQVGHRAELYSLQYEYSRSLGARGDVRWISPDDPGAGYDIEVLAPVHRLVEVKGSRSLDVTFVLSDNEWKNAAKFGSMYEIQYWGDVRLEEAPEDGYVRLRTSDYPIVIPDPSKTLRDPDWTIQPQSWRVRRSFGSPASASSRESVN